MKPQPCLPSPFPSAFTSRITFFVQPPADPRDNLDRRRCRLPLFGIRIILFKPSLVQFSFLFEERRASSTPSLTSLVGSDHFRCGLFLRPPMLRGYADETRLCFFSGQKHNQIKDEEGHGANGNSWDARVSSLFWLRAACRSGSSLE